VVIVCSSLLLTRTAWGQTVAPADSVGLADLRGLSAASEALAARVSPAIVQILVKGYAPGPGADVASLLAQRSSSGSGVIVDATGYVVTNAHVVAGARSIQVQFVGERGPGRSILRPRGRLVGAQLVGLDRETDLALLKVQASGLTSLPFGDSDALSPGTRSAWES
jgi:serine protease Do